jgi:hypothetical protein
VSPAVEPLVRALFWALILLALVLVIGFVGAPGVGAAA